MLLCLLNCLASVFGKICVCVLSVFVGVRSSLGERFYVCACRRFSLRLCLCACEFVGLTCVRMKMSNYLCACLSEGLHGPSVYKPHTFTVYCLSSETDDESS